MRETVPSVHLICRPQVDVYELGRYLDKVGAMSWLDRRVDEDVCDAELLVEAAGRACYRSWEPGLNANVTRVREDRAANLTRLSRPCRGSHDRRVDADLPHTAASAGACGHVGAG